MSKTTYEEYLKRYGSLTYKNTGTSMLPLLKQGRDAFIVRAVGEYETCKKWDVVLYKRPPESYVLHRVVRVLGNSYDILGYLRKKSLQEKSMSSVQRRWWSRLMKCIRKLSSLK